MEQLATLKMSYSHQQQQQPASALSLTYVEHIYVEHVRVHVRAECALAVLWCTRQAESKKSRENLAMAAPKNQKKSPDLGSGKKS